MGNKNGIITVCIIMGLLSACLAFAGEVIRFKNSEVQFLTIEDCRRERSILAILGLASVGVLIFTKIVSSFQLCGCPPAHVICISILAWLLMAADIYIIERVIDPNNFSPRNLKSILHVTLGIQNVILFILLSLRRYTSVKCFTAKRGLLVGAGALSILIISMEIICRVLVSRTPEPLLLSPQVVVQPIVHVHTPDNGVRSSER